jgi:hypothetical protein
LPNQISLLKKCAAERSYRAQRSVGEFQEFSMWP